MGVGFWKNKETKTKDNIGEYDLTQEPNFKFTNDLVSYLIEVPTRTLERAMAEYGKSKEELEEILYMGFLANGISDKFKFTWNVKDAIDSGALDKVGAFSSRVRDLLIERIEYKNAVVNSLNKELKNNVRG
ncbi:MAG: hypothetical protein K6D97_02065 [Clostridia bacterium]|nr:hypothetical protein [Clostridia bacterium]